MFRLASGTLRRAGSLSHTGSWLSRSLLRPRWIQGGPTDSAGKPEVGWVRRTAFVGGGPDRTEANLPLLWEQVNTMLDHGLGLAFSKFP